MEAQLKGAVLIALVVVPQWRCPILKPLSAKLPPKSETAPHPGWQDGTILEPGLTSNLRVPGDPAKPILQFLPPFFFRHQVQTRHCWHFGHLTLQIITKT